MHNTKFLSDLKENLVGLVSLILLSSQKRKSFQVFSKENFVTNCSHDAFLLAKNKPQPVPTSVTHAPPVTQQFGVSIEL